MLLGCVAYARRFKVPPARILSKPALSHSLDILEDLDLNIAFANEKMQCVYMSEARANSEIDSAHGPQGDLLVYIMYDVFRTS